MVLIFPLSFSSRDLGDEVLLDCIGWGTNDPDVYGHTILVETSDPLSCIYKSLCLLKLMSQFLLTAALLLSILCSPLPLC